MHMGSLILQGDPDFTIILGSGVPKFMGSLNLRDTGLESWCVTRFSGPKSTVDIGTPIPISTVDW